MPNVTPLSTDGSSFRVEASEGHHCGTVVREQGSSLYEAECVRGCTAPRSRTLKGAALGLVRHWYDVGHELAGDVGMDAPRTPSA